VQAEGIENGKRKLANLLVSVQTFALAAYKQRSQSLLCAHASLIVCLFTFQVSKKSNEISELPGEDQIRGQKTCLSFPAHLPSPILELSPLDPGLEHQPYQIAYQTNPTVPQ